MTSEETSSVTQENDDLKEEFDEEDQEIDLRGRKKTSKKTITKTVKIVKRSTSRRRVRSRRYSESDPLVIHEPIAPLILTPQQDSMNGSDLLGRPIEKSQSMGRISQRISFLDPSIPIRQHQPIQDQVGPPRNGLATNKRNEFFSESPLKVTEVPIFHNGLLAQKAHQALNGSIDDLDGTSQKANGVMTRKKDERIIDLQVDPILKRSDSMKRQKETEGHFYEAKSPANTLPRKSIMKPAKNGLSWPVELLVTHVEPCLASPKEESKQFKIKLKLDSWFITVHQTVRWSELKNHKNIEIDGISRLKIHQNAFAFEYSVMEF
ncbi:hypothetical protein TCAL_07738 [Tigriopus californicus]|uniref:Uncharacterized protein n=1 Tax=Tigriopus californicus TaxID=6832 RepID=A0A553PLJ8_TIGCA|nr:uncharacterized protein LOC131890080 [Tigriopus californicus]TRY78553.1 hypothetical protein TCAL_07738 [Tigriopus californicus]|eukprot:TCALIF_07738-PA protein Name:"Protein of unknown function" AED:0.05 eAED:0.05 QI:619/1/0.66/1/0.5/0.33/3/0/320